MNTVRQKKRQGFEPGLYSLIWSGVPTICFRLATSNIFIAIATPTGALTPIEKSVYPCTNLSIHPPFFGRNWFTNIPICLVSKVNPDTTNIGKLGTETLISQLNYSRKMADDTVRLWLKTNCWVQSCCHRHWSSV